MDDPTKQEPEDWIDEGDEDEETEWSHFQCQDCGHIQEHDYRCEICNATSLIPI